MLGADVVAGDPAVSEGGGAICDAEGPTEVDGDGPARGGGSSLLELAIGCPRSLSSTMGSMSGSGVGAAYGCLPLLPPNFVISMATTELEEPSPLPLPLGRIIGRCNLGNGASLCPAADADELSVKERSLLYFGAPRVLGSPRSPSGMLPFGVNDGCSNMPLPSGRPKASSTHPLDDGSSVMFGSVG